MNRFALCLIVIYLACPGTAQATVETEEEQYTCFLRFNGTPVLDFVKSNQVNADQFTLELQRGDRLLGVSLENVSGEKPWPWINRWTLGFFRNETRQESSWFGLVKKKIKTKKTFQNPVSTYAEPGKGLGLNLKGHDGTLGPENPTGVNISTPVRDFTSERVVAVSPGSVLFSGIVNMSKPTDGSYALPKGAEGRSPELDKSGEVHPQPAIWFKLAIKIERVKSPE